MAMVGAGLLLLLLVGVVVLLLARGQGPAERSVAQGADRKDKGKGDSPPIKDPPEKPPTVPAEKGPKDRRGVWSVDDRTVARNTVELKDDGNYRWWYEVLGQKTLQQSGKWSFADGVLVLDNRLKQPLGPPVGETKIQVQWEGDHRFIGVGPILQYRWSRVSAK
jgi:hypothetical protein